MRGFHVAGVGHIDDLIGTVSVMLDRSQGRRSRRQAWTIGERITLAGSVDGSQISALFAEADHEVTAGGFD